MNPGINEYLTGLRDTLQTLDENTISKVIDALRTAAKERKQVFTVGNGGSAATASHLATDLQKGLRTCTGKRMKVISLADSIGLITAWGNDYGFDDIFSGQLESLADSGDLLIAISGSGNSRNVLNAVETARQMGLTTIGWSGFDGGKLAQMVDIPVVIDSTNMQRIEDIQLVLTHVIFYVLTNE